MRKVLFLDRDGVIIKERGAYNYLPEHLIYVDGIEQNLKKAWENGFDLVIITNQGGIAKGYYTHDHVHQMHSAIAAHFESHGVAFLDWFYCPHHDVSGKCLCRKPGSLMLEKAIARYGINPKASYFIGDKDSDYEAGIKAGVNPVKIEANEVLRGYLDQILGE